MINQPQENPNIPANLAKEIEVAKNLVTITEAELIRLQGLVRSEQYTIGELNKSKLVLTRDVKKLDSDKIKIKERIVFLNKKIKEGKEIFSEAEKSYYEYLKIQLRINFKNEFIRTAKN